MAESGEDGGKQTTFSGTTCHPHPKADTKDAECCGHGWIFVGLEDSSPQAELVCQPLPKTWRTPAWAILSRHLEGCAQTAALLVTRTDLEQKWPRQGRRLEAAFTQHGRTLNCLPSLSSFASRTSQLTSTFAPAPCTQSVFAQVSEGSHRNSLGCNMSLLSRVQYSPTSMIFFL